MSTSQQREAVARLVTYCDCLIQRGKLPSLDELNLRHFTNEVCAAFDMAPCEDRLEAELLAIRQIMEKAS